MPDTLHLNLKHLLPDSMDTIYSSLLDFRRFGELHPHMKEVKILSENPGWVEYEITEEVYLLGFIKIHPKYRAKVFEVEKNRHICYESEVQKNMFLKIDLFFSKNINEAIIVEEKISLQSNRLIGKYFLRILQKAHLQFFRNLIRSIQMAQHGPPSQKT